jgi:hypothetical protein
MQANALSTSPSRVDSIAVENKFIMNDSCFNEYRNYPEKIIVSRAKSNRRNAGRGISPARPAFHPIGLDSFTCFKAGLQSVSEG